MQQEIDAMVIIKSADEDVSSRGIINANQARLGDYLPDLQTIIDAARYCRDAGFNVIPTRYSLTIKGSRKLFEAMFGVQLHKGMQMSGVGYERMPELLKGILVRIIFPGLWDAPGITHS